MPGREVYTATCRQASLSSGVTADVIMPGPVHPAEPYYSAFDVFLNTSIYEGLSIAILEAICRGCPVVSADAGGNAEALGPNDVLIEDSSDVDMYSRGDHRSGFASATAPQPAAGRPGPRAPPLGTARPPWSSESFSVRSRPGADEDAHPDREPQRRRPAAFPSRTCFSAGPRGNQLPSPSSSHCTGLDSCAVSRTPGSSSSAFTASAP